MTTKLLGGNDSGVVRAMEVSGRTKRSRSRGLLGSEFDTLPTGTSLIDGYAFVGHDLSLLHENILEEGKG